MKKIDIDANDQDAIRELLNSDPLDRNKNLKVMLNFLNNIEGQLVLNLDGYWGTGKTIFLKQLEFINQQEFEFPTQVTKMNNPSIVKKFKEKYEVLYFNAWENDLYESPLESLIFQLILKLEETDKDEAKIQGRIKKLDSLLKQAGILTADIALKKISAGFIEFSDIKPQNKDITKTITSMNEKKTAIAKLLKLISDSVKKTILIVVDELDRCKPSYAIEFLEIVKHLFSSEKIVFLFASNKEELTNTVKLIYGQDFDGYKYLNRFFDFEFTLPKINSKKYLEYKFSDELKLNWYHGKVIAKVCDYFNFTMRDIDRYISLCSTLTDFWLDNSNNMIPHSNFIDRVLLPYAIGLKIQSGNSYNKFILDNGLEELLNFCIDNELIEKRLFVNHTKDNNFDFNKEIENVYRLIAESEIYVSDYNTERRSMRDMLEILTMMSDFSTF